MRKWLCFPCRCNLVCNYTFRFARCDRRTHSFSYVGFLPVWPGLLVVLWIFVDNFNVDLGIHLFPYFVKKWILLISFHLLTFKPYILLLSILALMMRSHFWIPLMFTQLSSCIFRQIVKARDLLRWWVRWLRTLQRSN